MYKGLKGFWKGSEKKKMKRKSCDVWVLRGRFILFIIVYQGKDESIPHVFIT